ncbi:DUF1203 domain-containing protein [Sphingomonas canadensis]|uniref:DUF1203 domain-containing protein n=1 Tax=Sphingomonas canadensis TaxID=1219257 RepID=A0ABW3HAL9_9SPHN|nr:DUF1203 domain-containing protein [Sphingomonas canadensis]MCW3836518.1 DUF1203 domain-containing protein [Sphingomonas canadensis]
MSYRIEGLAPARFAALFGLDEAALAERGVRRVTATHKPGFPCRITLEDAEPGEALLLLNHTDHDVATPYRNSYAIYVREGAARAAVVEDEPAPVFAGRPIALRGYDAAGNLAGALLAMAGEADARIRELFARPEVAYIHAHNAAHGCFAARVERG